MAVEIEYFLNFPSDFKTVKKTELKKFILIKKLKIIDTNNRIYV